MQAHSCMSAKVQSPPSLSLSLRLPHSLPKDKQNYELTWQGEQSH